MFGGAGLEKICAIVHRTCSGGCYVRFISGSSHCYFFAGRGRMGGLDRRCTGTNQVGNLRALGAQRISLAQCGGLCQAHQRGDQGPAAGGLASRRGVGRQGQRVGARRGRRSGAHGRPGAVPKRQPRPGHGGGDAALPGQRLRAAAGAAQELSPAVGRHSEQKQPEVALHRALAQAVLLHQKTGADHRRPQGPEDAFAGQADHGLDQPPGHGAGAADQPGDIAGPWLGHA